MNIAIIGSNGFIGSHLANYLSHNDKYKLWLFGRSQTNSLEMNAPYHSIDFISDEKFNTIFSSIDIVYYLASATIPSSSWENPLSELESNLTPFLNFIKKISTFNIKKIVFASSAGTVYGPSSNKLKENDDKNPFSPYGIIKLAIEHFLNYNKTKNGIEFDIYRISNVYGEGQNTLKGLGIINTFIECIINKNEVQVFGDGYNIRNYIYIYDVVKLLEYSIISDFNSSNIFNLSSNDTVTINNLVEIIKNAVPKKFTVNYLKSRKSDNTIIKIDNSKLIALIPNFKFTPIEQGISQTYHFIKNHISLI